MQRHQTDWQHWQGKSPRGLKLPPCEQIHVEANMIITKYMCIAILPICRIFFWWSKEYTWPTCLYMYFIQKESWPKSWWPSWTVWQFGEWLQKISRDKTEYKITIKNGNHWSVHDYNDLTESFWSTQIQESTRQLDIGLEVLLDDIHSRYLPCANGGLWCTSVSFFAEQIFITISNRNVQVQPFREHSESGSFGTAGDGNMKQLCTKHN